MSEIISIHSLRMEGDHTFHKMHLHAIISIHSLRMEGDPRRRRISTDGRAFQSTPSAWRETTDKIPLLYVIDISIHSLRMEGDLSSRISVEWAENFNPLPPHGGRLIIARTSVRIQYFNPLPPHGGRLCFSCFSSSKTTFQSTPSAWRETCRLRLQCTFS